MNIESIKRKLLVKYPLFGSVVAHSNFIEESSIKTAATDGKDIYYNLKFAESITEEEQIFLFAHEVCHIAFNHIPRSKGKKKKIWNKATDAVINAFLHQDGLPMIQGVIDIPEAIYYDAEEMYQKLLKDEKEQTENKQDDTSKNQDVGHDSHSMWDKAIEKIHNEKSQDKQSDENEVGKYNNEIKKITELGEKRAFQKNRSERKKQLEELRNALASQSHGHGNHTDGSRRYVNDVGVSKPLIDWRRVLKETVKYDVDWSYQNASIEDGVVTPYLEEIPCPETEILLDTSGSIDEKLLRNFLRECKHILQSSKVKVGCFDTKFYGFTEVRNVTDIDQLIFHGSGGTDFEVAVNAFSKRVENKIIFTDGYASMPKTSLDAIWVVFGEKINPLGGKVIYIDEEQLEKLYYYQINHEISGSLSRR